MAPFLRRGAAACPRRRRAGRGIPYATLPPEIRPRAESLHDVTLRLLPYWYDSIVPSLRPGTTVLVVSHGNTLRALVKHLEAIGDEEIAALEIPHGIPLLYELGPGSRPRRPAATSDAAVVAREHGAWRDLRLRPSVPSSKRGRVSLCTRTYVPG